MPQTMKRDASGWLSRLTPESIEKYSANGTWSGKMVHECLWERALHAPDQVVLISGSGTEVTVKELADDARALAATMVAEGLRQGDVVSFQLPNWTEAAVINIAASALGLVVNPIVPIYRGAECQAILSDAHTKLLFVPRKFRGFDYVAMVEQLRGNLPQLRHVVSVDPDAPTEASYGRFLEAGRGKRVDWPKVDPNAIKLVLFTSGTTGRAKGALHTYNTLAAGHVGLDYWKVDSRDVVLMPSPVTHITGYMWALEFPVLFGFKTVLMVQWNADAAVQLIERFEATLSVGSMPFLQELMNAATQRGTALPSLRLFACGGAPVPPTLIAKAHSIFVNCRCHRMYGATEAPGITRGWMGPDEAALAANTDGKIVGWEVKIIDDQGTPVPPGTDGEIVVRGAGMMVGYTDPEQTAGSFTADDYFITGDIGHETTGGGLVITGRKKDLIIRGGENLSAKEIEDALQRHPGIRAAAVVSMPHPRLGEGVCAYVIPASTECPPATDALLRFVEASGLARQKLPERFEFISELPRTPSGKVRKDLLRTAIRDKLLQECAP